MNKMEIADRFAEMWKKSRHMAGRSQADMAKAIGVSKKTVQCWEEGTSCPNLIKGLEWFEALGLQPLPYFLEVLYPEFTIANIDSDTDVELTLDLIIKDLPSQSKRKLLYALSGLHGSSVLGMIEMTNAYLQSPLRDRLNIAQSVALNYEIAAASGKLRCMNHVQPDMGFLYRSIGRGKDAVLRGVESYTTEVGE